MRQILDVEDFSVENSSAASGVQVQNDGAARNGRLLAFLQPATAERFHVNIKDPHENILGGVAYLRWLLQHFDGDVRLALAGYNAGERTVEKCGNQVPDITETKNYVKNITTAYGKTYHPVLKP